MPGRLTSNGHRTLDRGAGGRAGAAPAPAPRAVAPAGAKPPLRGALVLGAADAAGLANELRTALAEARQGRHLDPPPPSATALAAPERIAIDYADGDELRGEGRARAAARSRRDNPAAWKALRAPRHLPRQRRAGQGRVPLHRPGLAVREHARRAARTRAGRRRHVRRGRRDHDAAARGPALSDIIFVDPADAAAIARAEEELRRTEITQPAVLTVDIALTRLLGEYGIAPDLVMGHSLGEYGALVAAGVAVVRGRARGRQRPRARDGQPEASTTPARWPR